jgi:hypothetical protein
LQVAYRVLSVAFMNSCGRSIVWASLFVALATGCAGVLPDPIYANQVEEYFPDAEPAASASPTSDDTTAGAEATEAPTATDVTAALEGTDAAPPPVRSPETAHELRVAAGHCAARLNGHRSTAETVSIIQSIISGIGGVTGGVGSALAVVHFDSPDINTAMGVMGSIGAGITFVGNLVLGIVANPLEEARRQGLGLRSWEMAVELQIAHADAEAVRASLERCTLDLAPEMHVVGLGEPYSE